MKYTADTKLGMADPYWYEWSVGQSYLVDIQCIFFTQNTIRFSP